MIEVKTKKCETGQINIIIRWNLKKVMCNVIKIFRITRDQAKFYEVKIEKMKNKESKNRCPCPDHKPGEK